MLVWGEKKNVEKVMRSFYLVYVQHHMVFWYIIMSYA